MKLGSKINLIANEGLKGKRRREIKSRGEKGERREGKKDKNKSATEGGGGGRRGISILVEQGGGDEAAYTMEVAKIDFFNPVCFQDTCNTYFKVRRLNQCY